MRHVLLAMRLPFTHSIGGQWRDPRGQVLSEDSPNGKRTLNCHTGGDHLRGHLRRTLNVASSQLAAVHRVRCSLLMYYYLMSAADLTLSRRLGTKAQQLP